MNNKRRYSRMGVQGIEADIADDIGFCSAQVRDISRFGICLSDISRKLHVKGDNFLIVISCNGRRFKVYAQSKWEADEGFDKIVGVEIKNAPWAWTEFVSTMEPIEDDVWGTPSKMMI